jgi:hypothetical protein
VLLLQLLVLSGWCRLNGLRPHYGLEPSFDIDILEPSSDIDIDRQRRVVKEVSVF